MPTLEMFKRYSKLITLSFLTDVANTAYKPAIFVSSTQDRRLHF
jgi:hypothetical protein